MAILSAVSGLNTATADKTAQLGDIFYDGTDKYVYVQAKTAVATANLLLMNSAGVSLDVVLTGYAGTATATGKHEGVTYAAGAILYYATGGLTANQYSGFKMLVDDSTDTTEEGQYATVVGNSADHLFLDRALTTTLNAADADITLFNQYHVAPATASTEVIPVGVAPITVTDEYYFWMQTEGVCWLPEGGGTQTANLNIVSGDDLSGGGGTILGTTAEGPYDARNVGYILYGAGTANALVLVRLALPK